jgi:multiple sugar transport system permease protein
MSLNDLIDSAITWIPSEFSFKNYLMTIEVINYWESLLHSVIIAGAPTLCQVAVCSFVGYGLARYNFKGKSLIMVILILSFCIPTQVMNIPIFWLYAKMKITGSLNAFIIPALLGQGLKSPLFILICWAFFRQIPRVLSEAAQIDGAGHFKQFFRIGIPSAKGALVVVFLFSFVWYWNESYLTRLYLYKSGKPLYWHPLTMELDRFESAFNSVASGNVTTSSGQSMVQGASINQAYSMAATVLSILPLLIIYLVLQKQFVESIEKSGITGE